MARCPIETRTPSPRSPVPALVGLTVVIAASFAALVTAPSWTAGGDPLAGAPWWEGRRPAPPRDWDRILAPLEGIGLYAGHEPGLGPFGTTGQERAGYVPPTPARLAELEDSLGRPADQLVALLAPHGEHLAADLETGLPLLEEGPRHVVAAERIRGLVRATVLALLKGQADRAGARAVAAARLSQVYERGTRVLVGLPALSFGAAPIRDLASSLAHVLSRYPVDLATAQELAARLATVEPGFAPFAIGLRPAERAGARLPMPASVAAANGPALPGMPELRAVVAEAERLYRTLPPGERKAAGGIEGVIPAAHGWVEARTLWRGARALAEAAARRQPGEILKRAVLRLLPGLPPDPVTGQPLMVVHPELDVPFVVRGVGLDGVSDGMGSSVEPTDVAIVVPVRAR